MSSKNNQSTNRKDPDKACEYADQNQIGKTTFEDLWSTCLIRSINTEQASLLLLEIVGDSSKFRTLASERLQQHYITEKLLRKLGREKIADWLKEKAPVDKKSRSGELGEILATEFVNSGHLPFQVPIHRLVWKDGRELAMRGEDLLGFQFNSNPLGFLKGEVKSRESLSTPIVTQARTALKKNDGLPLSHTLSYYTERLYEADEDEKAAAIEQYVRERLPSRDHVSHLIFTFSQNDPSAFLQEDAKQARKPVKHYAVGLRVQNHQKLIEEVYTRATNG